MATTGAYTATGIKFHRKRDTADVSKVRRTFLRESEIFRQVQIHSTAAVLAPAVVISFQSVTLRDVKESSY